MKNNLDLNKSHLLKILKLIRPVVIKPTRTLDMGMECLIATKKGIVYPFPGMFLFCGGDWPIKKVMIMHDSGDVDNINAFSLRTSQNPNDTIFFKDIEPMEAAFIDLFDVDIREPVSRSTLADANANRDWRIYAEFAQRLINQARKL